LLALVGFVMGIIWFVDPYGSIPFSPPLARTPMATNQRYSYPAFARDTAFASALVGTSTSRLLQPAALNAHMGGRFVNLSMNSATAYEEARILEVFAAAHEAPKTVVVGVDVSWCSVEDKLTKYTFRRFPEWMYDSNRWNDIVHMLEFKTFEVLGKQMGYMLGVKEAKYGRDGYADFLPADDAYELDKVRKELYSAVTTKRRNASPAGVTAQEKASWQFPSHPLLRDMLNTLPASTRKVLYFVPYHEFYQPAHGTLSAAQWRACKDRVVEMAGQTENAVVLDFMLSSPLPRQDDNYWDPLHYTRHVADRFVTLIAAGARGLAAPQGETGLLTDRVN